jgi:hypothetical protein
MNVRRRELAVKISSLKPGMTLYDVRPQRGSHGGEGTWTATVVSVHLDEDTPYAMISWNRNKATKYTDVPYTRWPKEWIRGGTWRPGRFCALCHAEEREGHRPDCTHPKAKKATK